MFPRQSPRSLSGDCEGTSHSKSMAHPVRLHLPIYSASRPRIGLHGASLMGCCVVRTARPRRPPLAGVRMGRRAWLDGAVGHVFSHIRGCGVGQMFVYIKYYESRRECAALYCSCRIKTLTLESMVRRRHPHTPSTSASRLRVLRPRRSSASAVRTLEFPPRLG